MKSPGVKQIIIKYSDAIQKRDLVERIMFDFVYVS